MIDGPKMQIAGQEYTIPPLNFAALKKLTPKLPALADPATPQDKKLDLMLEAIGYAMRRNYPEVTDEALLEMIDLGNIGAVFSAAMAASGFQAGETVPGEKK